VAHGRGSIERLQQQLDARTRELAEAQRHADEARRQAAEALEQQTATSEVLRVIANRLGLVASLARPGGNLTGINSFSGEVAAKRLNLLRELAPIATRVAVLVNPTNASDSAMTLRDVQAAARNMGLQIQVLKASTGGEIDAAFATFAGERPDALLVGGELFLQQSARPFGPLGIVS
jgi:putative tryptophan/tyrosine transport system substrate-binding protein